MENKRLSLISSLFLELNTKYEYAILHHIENVFSNEDDIDLIINCNNSDLLNFIKEFSLKNDCILLNYYCIDSSIYRFDLIFKNENKFERLELDCACNSNGNDLLSINCGKLLLSKKEVFLNNIKFYKVSDTDEYAYYIKKKAFKNSKIENYYDYLINLNNQSNINEINHLFNIEKKYFKSKKFKFKFYINKLKLIINRFVLSPNISIAFLGSDGSGKSTIIKQITDLNLFNNQYYFHLKPKKSKTNQSDLSVDDPHKHKPYSSVKSLIKLMFFILQYNSGWIKNILKLRIKPSLVIFDRYYDDLLVDSKRYRYGGSLKIAKFIRYFIPQPDLYFILTTDADIIYKRKQEVPFEELERQIKEYRNLGDAKRYINIDVNRTPEEISTEIIEHIARKMNERY